MRSDDSDLERLIIAAAPPAHADVERARARVRGIVHERMLTRSHRSRRSRGIAIAAFGALAAAAVVVVLCVVLVPAQIQPETHAAPTPLAVTADAGSKADVRASVLQRLDQIPSPAASAERSSSRIEWFLDPEASRPNSETAALPEGMQLRWDATGRGEFTRFGVDPVTDSEQLGIELAPTSEVIRSQAYAPGALELPVTSEPPRTAGGLEQYLQDAGFGGVGSADELFSALDQLQSFWTLSNAQQSAVMTLIFERDDTVVLGTTHDRLGRDAYVVQAGLSPDGAVRKRLLISMDTGRLLGIETSRVAEVDGIAPGTVTAYTLWDVDFGGNGHGCSAAGCAAAAARR